MFQRLLFSFGLIFTSTFFSVYALGQSSVDGLLKSASILVLQEKNADARELLMQSDSLRFTEFGNVIEQILDGSNVNYSVYKAFFREVWKDQAIEEQDVFRAYSKWLKEPKSEKVNLDYVECLSYVGSKLINDGNVDLSGKVQADLVSYLSKFSGNDVNLMKARFYESLHDLTLLLIQSDTEEGIKRSNQLLEKAKKIDDINLIICAKYYLSEFLVASNALEEVIKISRECYYLDNNRSDKSDFYTKNLIVLVDALIYQENNEEEVLELLTNMYNHPDSKLHSYSLYAKLLHTVGSENDAITCSVFDQFQVSGIVEFTDKVFRETKNTIDPTQYYYVLLEGARALKVFGESGGALQAMFDAIQVTRSVYSEKLANSLAKQKAEKIRIEADAEIRTNELLVENEKFLSKIYIGSAFLVFTFLCFAIIALWKQRKQKQLLEVKNIEISQKNLSLEERDHEKTVLVKEIHHRVKNNFQIISSLLELQTKGIEDEHALELAKEGQKRLRSMAIIHQKLYQNDILEIDLDEYMQDLTMEIYSAYALKNVDINIDVDSRIKLDLDTAIPLGLIVNELITNAFKYGFSVERENTLNIKVESFSDHYVMQIADNGPGMDEKVDLQSTKSIGLKLVRRLAKQLMGSIESNNELGAKFTLEFKDTAMRLEF